MTKQEQEQAIEDAITELADKLVLDTGKRGPVADALENVAATLRIQMEDDPD
jgi:hypothetical protein